VSSPASAAAHSARVLSPLPIDLQSLTVISHDALPLPDGRAASPPQHPGRFAFLSSHPLLWRWYVVCVDGGGSGGGDRCGKQRWTGPAAANATGDGRRGRAAHDSGRARPSGCPGASPSYF